MIIKQMYSYLSLRFDNFTYKSTCLCNSSGSNLHHLCWFKRLFGTCAASSTDSILLSHSQLGMLFCGVVLSPFTLYLPQGNSSEQILSFQMQFTVCCIEFCDKLFKTFMPGIPRYMSYRIQQLAMVFLSLYSNKMQTAVLP